MADILSKQSFYLLAHREINYPTALNGVSKNTCVCLEVCQQWEVHGTCEPWMLQVSVGS